MKTTIKPNPSKLRIAGLTLACLFSAEVSVLAAETPPLTIEPVSLSIIRDLGNAPERGRNPLNFMGSGPTSGTKLLVQCTPAPGLKAKLVNSGAKLEVFEDDKRKNLLEGGEPQRRPSLFGPSNEKLTVIPGRGDPGGPFQLALNAPSSPSPGATKLVVAGTLLFAPADAKKKEDGHGEMALEEGEIVTVGPVRLKFTKPRQGRVSWYVQMVAEEQAVSPTLMLFGEDVDRVVYDSHRGSGFQSMGGKPNKKDPFSGVMAHGFNCPGDMLSRIKVQYYRQDDLIKVPFNFETGLGLQGTPN